MTCVGDAIDLHALAMNALPVAAFPDNAVDVHLTLLNVLEGDGPSSRYCTATKRKDRLFQEGPIYNLPCEWV